MIWYDIMSYMTINYSSAYGGCALRPLHLGRKPPLKIPGYVAGDLPQVTLPNGPKGRQLDHVLASGHDHVSMAHSDLQ